MSGVPLTRRQLVGAAGLGAASLATGCAPRDAAPPAVWLGAGHARGHRLRNAPGALPAAAVQRRAAVLVVGAGIAGLAAARAYARAGVDDVHLLELEEAAGGNSRGHAIGGVGCPLGAHYLPLPARESVEVAEWLHEIGLLTTTFGRTVADERHLCHAPQERLFIDGAWSEGLLPPCEPLSPMAAQAHRLAQVIRALQRSTGGARAFAVPAHRSAWTAAHAGLDAVSFAHWLGGHGITDTRLRWYLDYCCRDDYGAGADTVSAWAGVHYFASRHGFHAPGDAEGERDAVFTWPQGNGWLVQRLAEPLADRLHTGRTVLRVSETRHAVQVLAFDEDRKQLEAWTAGRVVLALPLFVAARVLESPPQALRDAVPLLGHAPWLVSQLQLSAPLLDRPGAPPSWDNVVYGSAGLGYVDDLHQSLRPDTRRTVITAYHALPRSERAALLSADPAPWVQRVLQDLSVAHPDIRHRVQRIELMRWGHGMAIPQPGLQRHGALLALRHQRGRVRFAHADLAGYSVFEEAFTAGCEVAQDSAAPSGRRAWAS